MKKYLLIYKTLLRANFAELVVYRTNFINNLLGGALWGGVSVAVIIFLTSKTPSVFGWTRYEILLLTGISNIFVSIFYFLFSRNFDRFSPIIHQGKLDSLLLKPIDSQFAMSMWFINFSGLFRIIVGIVFTTWVLSQMNYTPSLVSFLAAGLLLVCGLVILYSLWYVVSTLLIWWTNLSNVSGLLYELNTFTRFPPQMYKSAGIILFYIVLPLTLMISTPSQALLGTFDIQNIILLSIFALTFFLFSRVFWKFALRFYTSASG